MDGILLVAVGTALLTFVGIVEGLRHRRNLRAIPIRIHVNGTRGKSAVTRLIAAGLRAGGIRTCAKTTGTLARMIFPDGSEYPVHRPARANIREQIRIVRSAVRARAEALVIECMALQPALQSLCELRLVQSTHGVITNARADHLDVMGPTSVDVAKSLSGTVPLSARLYTAEQKHLPILRYAAQDRDCDLIEVDEDAVASVSWDELDRFPYVEHPDNVALALRVCQDLGVERNTALAGMWDAQPDPGVMSVYQVQEADRQIAFVNGFAANDPESTGKIWELILARFSRMAHRIAIINCRADRPDRSEQIASSCLEWTRADHYLVVGTATDIFVRKAIAAGMDACCLTQAEKEPVDELIDHVNEIAGHSAMVMGMGNISGPGLELVRYYRDRAVSNATTTTLPLRKAA